MKGSKMPVTTSRSPYTLQPVWPLMTAEQNGWLTNFQIGLKKTNPTTMATTSARAALTRRLRSSRMCSMSGIRPSGSCFLDAWSMRLPTTRAPVTVSASFGISGPWSVSCLDGLLVRGHRCGLLDGRLLQLANLPLQAVDLLLGGQLLRGDRRGRGHRRGDLLRRYRDRDRGGRSPLGFGVVIMQTRDLGLEDPHRPPERPGRDRQFR